MSGSNHLAEKAAAGLSLSEETPVRVPIKVFGWLAFVVAAGAIAWGLTTKNVADNTKRIEVLESDQRTAREVLIRIDERTAEIKRRLDQNPR